MTNFARKFCVIARKGLNFLSTRAQLSIRKTSPGDFVRLYMKSMQSIGKFIISHFSPPNLILLPSFWNICWCILMWCGRPTCHLLCTVGAPTIYVLFTMRFISFVDSLYNWPQIVLTYSSSVIESLV